MGVAACYYYLTMFGVSFYALGQWVLPDVLEESWCIHYIQFVQKLWEVPLDFEDKLSIYFGCSLIRHIFQLRSFHVNDNFYLINTFLIDKFLAISEFVSPGVLQFFNEEMNEDINRLNYLH